MVNDREYPPLDSGGWGCNFPYGYASDGYINGRHLTKQYWPSYSYSLSEMCHKIGGISSRYLPYLVNKMM